MCLACIYLSALCYSFCFRCYCLLFCFYFCFYVCRQNEESAQRILFSKAKFSSFLADSFIPYPATAADLPAKDAPLEIVNKSAARGVVMNLANAVRLQVMTYVCSRQLVVRYS
jgi:hypothetical protein